MRPTSIALAALLMSCGPSAPLARDGGADLDAGPGDGGVDAGVDAGPTCPSGCSASQVCVNGQCYETSCTSQICPSSCVCFNDACTPTNCVGVGCSAGFTCAGGGQCEPTSCAGTSCPNGQVCSSSGACVSIDCFGVDCPAGQLCANGSCLPTSCGSTACATGDVCLDGGCTGLDCVGLLCPAGEVCSGGGCVQTCASGCTVPTNLCSMGPGSCVAGLCSYPPQTNGTTCNDGNPCTTNDLCDGGGGCVGTPVSCEASPGQCWHSAGTCLDGGCSYAPLAQGTACDAGDACTSNDVCDGQGGCSGTAKVCDTSPGQCWSSAGTCAAGKCSYAALAKGTTCDDGDACTVKDVCNGSGTCAGTAMACTTPPNDCYAATGSCAAGKCSYAAKAKGSSCTGGNVCQTYTCDGSGTCGGVAKADGKQINGVWEVCCGGKETVLKSATDCGGCGLGCAAGEACVDLGSKCNGTTAYYCSCGSNSQCPKNGTCVDTFWQSCWYLHCAAGSPTTGTCANSYCGPNETVHSTCAGTGCSNTPPEQPCYCEY